MRLKTAHHCVPQLQAYTITLLVRSFSESVTAFPGLLRITVCIPRYREPQNFVVRLKNCAPLRPLAARFSCKVRFQFPESCLRSQRPSTSFPDYYHFHFSFSNTTRTVSYLKLFILIRTKNVIVKPYAYKLILL